MAKAPKAPKTQEVVDEADALDTSGEPETVVATDIGDTPDLVDDAADSGDTEQAAPDDMAEAIAQAVEGEQAITGYQDLPGFAKDTDTHVRIHRAGDDEPGYSGDGWVAFNKERGIWVILDEAFTEVRDLPMS